MKNYDAIIIGAGQAGVPLAKKLAKAGLKTALIERTAIGGTCINYGCTPTKTMIASARMAYMANRSKEYGIGLTNVTTDMPAVIRRKNGVVDSFRNGSEQGLKNTQNLDLIFGEAIFTGNKTLAVSLNDGRHEEITAAHIFINTGGRAAIPHIEGLDTIPYLTSTSILDLTEVPKHLVIIGGSYIALEFGQMFRRFGTEVTLLENSSRFLAREDADIANAMRQILEEDGITLHTDTKISSLGTKDKEIIVNAIISGKEHQIKGSHLLLAAGRIPNTDKLELDKAGIETNERGYIKVNGKLETNIKGIYALGDVNGGPAFTHISYNDYVVVSKNILGHADATTTNRQVPYVMFTDPELGRIGINEEEARKNGLNIKVAAMPMTHVARAIETSDTRGMMKAIVDADTKKILGAAILGIQGGELMTLLQMAMAGGITYEQLKEMIFAHPTYAESINNLFLSLDN